MSKGVRKKQRVVNGEPRGGRMNEGGRRVDQSWKVVLAHGCIVLFLTVEKSHEKTKTNGALTRLSSLPSPQVPMETFFC